MREGQEGRGRIERRRIKKNATMIGPKEATRATTTAIFASKEEEEVHNLFWWLVSFPFLWWFVHIGMVDWLAGGLGTCCGEEGGSTGRSRFLSSSLSSSCPQGPFLLIFYKKHEIRGLGVLFFSHGPLLAYTTAAAAAAVLCLVYATSLSRTEGPSSCCQSDTFLPVWLKIGTDRQT